MLEIEARDGAVRFAVYARPRASRTEIAGVHGDAIRIRLAAAPVEGAANAELVSFLSKKLAVPKSAVRIVSGTRGKRKVIEVSGLSGESVRRALL